MDQAHRDQHDDKRRMDALIDSLERHADLEEGCSFSRAISESTPILQQRLKHDSSVDPLQSRDKLRRGKEVIDLANYHFIKALVTLLIFLSRLSKRGQMHCFI